jgi:hypothetical protein
VRQENGQEKLCESKRGQEDKQEMLESMQVEEGLWLRIPISFIRIRIQIYLFSIMGILPGTFQFNVDPDH